YRQTQEICKQLAWVAEIHSFAHCWSPKNLEQMKGWPAKEYVQRVVQLRMWAERVKQVPSTVITCNQLLFVDCSSVQQEIGMWDARQGHGEGAVSAQWRRQKSCRVVGWDQGRWSDRGWCSFFLQLEQYQSQMTELQERVEYVRALNEVIHQCFRPLSLEEENLENTLLDTWEAFVYQQQEASDFIVSRRLSIIAELVDALEGARAELQELLTMATTGRFLDPSQSPCAMEQELRELYRRFQATASRVAELCRSQRILTGMRATGPLPASAGRQIPSTRYTSLLLSRANALVSPEKCPSHAVSDHPHPLAALPVSPGHLTHPSYFPD
uniref:Dynein heavy chain domain 1 n=1 Tax=Pelusios castaneus TaxID=367368 RepID=A0A8C8SHT7_9SAUR